MSSSKTSLSRASDNRETALPQRLARYHADVDGLFWGWNNIWLDPAFRSWNIEASLDQVRCPVLVIQGAQDEYGSVRQVEAIQRQIPSASTVILDDCGHAPHRDQAQATLSAISEFVQQLDLARG